MSKDIQPGNLQAATDMLTASHAERDALAVQVVKLGTERDKVKRTHEILYDLAFQMGYRWVSAGEPFTEAAGNLLGGALGIRDRVYQWAEVFDAVWEAKSEDDREDYFGELDTFFEKAFDAFEKEVEQYMRNVTTKVVSIQVTPITETHRDGQTIVEAQVHPDSTTTGWGVYKRFVDGSVRHVCDCGNEDDATLMGGFLAASHSVAIEARPEREVERCFRVKWEIDMHATTPHEAAEKALEVQRNTDSTALVFDVHTTGKPPVKIDLEENT